MTPAPRSGAAAAALLAVGLSACGGGGADSAPPADTAPKVSTADAVRFLEQASFGPTDQEVKRVQSLGLDAYLRDQFSRDPSQYSGYAYLNYNSSQGCPSTLPAGNTCYRDNYSPFLLQNQFFRQAINGDDQLRQRVAFALSQIMVVSGQTVNEVYGLAAYEQLLRRDAFGNFRTLLYDITLNPAMGRYLDMAHNDKPNPSAGTAPNENYAREVLQLFSIGVNKLNIDGTPQRGSDGEPLPAYDQDIIEGYAHVFTGWTYQAAPNYSTPGWNNPSFYNGTMQEFSSHHDTTNAKTLLDRVLPPQQNQDDDLNAAIDSIFNHSNVGPFIGRQLIQHLVTSNPSPAYVERVATVFNDDGSNKHVRGNLQAVIRAILLDPEARGDLKTDPGYGKLREPALFLAAVMRGVGGSSDGVYLRSASANLQQDIYNAPSVFSFYPPDFPIQGTELQGPAFAIFNATSSLNRTNTVLSLLNAPIAPDSSVPDATGTQLNLAPWSHDAADPQALVDHIDTVFFHQSLSADMRNTLIQTINAIDPNDPDSRARAALYLALSSSQYQVEQ